jgi:hydroxymethylpyrimidine/phosphomethylpyrimidine kinase
MENKIPNVLTIAGVDPSGGAGMLADIKVMSALGCYGTAVIAALTAQNTRAVTGVLPVPPEFVTAQLDTLFADVRIDAVKIGMLGQAPVIRAVAGSLKKYAPKWIVLDPVMVAKSGDKLLEDSAIDALKTELLPLASVITPNLPEASVLLGREVARYEEMRAAAADLHALCGGRTAIYLKGGHLPDRAVDILFNGKTYQEFETKRTETKNTHGTGCSLSSAIASFLAKTGDLKEACESAKAYIAEAIRSADQLSVGTGHGPIHHFVRLWR